MEWVTWRRVWAACLVASTALHGAAFLTPKPGTVFSGFLLNSGDPWGYMGFSRCFAAAGFLIDNPFAPSAAKPAFFNLLWLLVGKIQALFGVGFLPVYYALGAAASGLMFFCLWAFSVEFLGEGPPARLAFLLAGLGGGLGWIPALFSDSLTAALRPLDLFHHEGFPLVSALFFPHFALSTAVLVAIMLWFHRGAATGNMRWSLGAAALFLSLGFFHPYHMVTVATVTAVWVTVEQILAGRRFYRGWLHLAVLGAAALPPFLYYRWFFRQPNWNIWAEANVVQSVGVGVLLGLGPLLLLAAVGLWRGGRAGLAGNRFLLVWSLAGLALLFSSPLVKFEAKLAEGLVVPLAVLGAVGFLGPREHPFRCRLGAPLLVLFLLPSTAVLAVKSLHVVRGRERGFLPAGWTVGASLYRGDEEVMRHLAQNPPEGALLMVPWEEGRLLPAVADIRVFVSGEDITPDFEWRWRAAYDVYADRLSSAERHLLLKSLRVTHLWYSPVWGFGFEADKEPYLAPVFVSRGAGVWRIAP